MFKAGDKKSKPLRVCCPSEMLIASDFFLMAFRNIIFKFGTYGSLSNLTFGNYVRLSDWWRLIDSIITLLVFERLEKIE